MPVKFTHTNTLMDECLCELESYWSEKDPKLAGDAVRFATFILADVVHHQGCYLLRSQSADWKPDPDAEYIPDRYAPDRSGYEDFANHHHVSEFVTSGTSSIGVLGIGIALAEVLYLKLQKNFPAVHFRISVSFPVKPIDPDDATVRYDCRVSFHAIREDEIIFGELDGFRYDAVGILEF